jgi:hypothetical protein
MTLKRNRLSREGKKKKGKRLVKGKRHTKVETNIYRCV